LTWLGRSRDGVVAGVFLSASGRATRRRARRPMQLDPTGEFIRHISAAVPLDGRSVLEVGCGSGRVTRDLAARVGRLHAVDPDEGAVTRARAGVPGGNVTFAVCTAEALLLPEGAYDAAVFTLSLHHVPEGSMGLALATAARGLRSDGTLLVIEPGEHGSLIDAEVRFDVGDGDESAAKSAARRAVVELEGWRVVQTIGFETRFHFDGADDFLANLPPRPGGRFAEPELRRFLADRTVGDRIELWAERTMSVLRRNG
jgi:SAM-dependent methyltransferase